MPNTPYKLYTSRYQNPALAGLGNSGMVGITRGTPRFRLQYTLLTNLRDLAPSREAFSLSTPEEFIPVYIAGLEMQGVEKFKQILDAAWKKAGKPKNLILLCFEDCKFCGSPPYTEDTPLVNWCHRLCFGIWWEIKTGGKVWEVDQKQNNGLPCQAKIFVDDGITMGKIRRMVVTAVITAINSEMGTHTITNTDPAGINSAILEDLETYGFLCWGSAVNDVVSAKRGDPQMDEGSWYFISEDGLKLITGYNQIGDHFRYYFT